MALVRWEPARELTPLQTIFSTFFDTPTTDQGVASARRFVPAIDLAETDEHFVLHADLPGVDPAAVKIEVADGVLTLEGEREVRVSNARRVERASGSFRRSLRLPKGVDAGAIAASFDRGVLEIRIPKPAEVKPQRVAIAVGAEAAPASEDAATA